MDRNFDHHDAFGHRADLDGGDDGDDHGVAGPCGDDAGTHDATPGSFSSYARTSDVVWRPATAGHPCRGAATASCYSRGAAPEGCNLHGWGFRQRRDFHIFNLDGDIRNIEDAEGGVGGVVAIDLGDFIRILHVGPADGGATQAVLGELGSVSPEEEARAEVQASGGRSAGGEEGQLCGRRCFALVQQVRVTFDFARNFAV